MRKILTEKVGWYMVVCLLLALLVGSCHQDRELELELELIPELTLQEKVATLVPAARNAVMGRSLSNVFSAPKLESLKTHGKRAFTAPLPHAKLERLGWEALLIAAVDPAGRLHTAVIVRPAKRGDSYSQYGFSPEGYQQYRIEVSKGRPVRWFVPRQSSHYETVFGGNAKLKKSGSGDDGEWNCGEIDECVAYPYDHIDDDDDFDGGSNWDDTNWWDDTPPRDGNDGAGGGSSGGDTDDSDKPGNPCEQKKRIAADTEFEQRLEFLYESANSDTLENGYTRRIGGEMQPPTARTAGNIKFTYSGKYVEEMHSHSILKAGSTRFSANDIRGLFLRYAGGYMEDPATFRYGVVSGYGCLIAQITDVEAFKAFAKNYSLATNGEKLKEDFDELPIIVGSVEEGLANFIQLMDDKNSGLNFIFRKSDAEGTAHGYWELKKVSNGLLLNSSCF